MGPFTAFTANTLARIAAPFFPGLVWRRDDGTRTVYLTFDDGPTEETPALLDLLARHDAPASFFFLGAAVRKHPDLARAARDAGHTVGQHTDTHPDPWKTAPTEVLAECAAATETIEDALGEGIGWMRPPYGHVTSTLRAWCDVRDQEIAMWDVMPGDFLPSSTAAGVADHVERRVRPGSLVVLHEGGHAERITPAALDRLLPRLAADGYRFAAL